MKINTSLSLCAGAERDRYKARSSEDGLLARYYRSPDLRKVLVAKRAIFELAISAYGNGKMIYVQLSLMCFLSSRYYDVSCEAKLSTKYETSRTHFAHCIL